MIRYLRAAIVFSGAIVLGYFLGVSSPVPRAYASEMQEPPHDPKKKKAGEACKSSSECQSHHSCEKVGDKNVCKAPPRPQLPPGAVT